MKILLALLAVFIVFRAIFYKTEINLSIINPKNTIDNLQSKEDFIKESIENNLSNIHSTIFLNINDTEDYNYKTRDEIYEIRKNHVANSLFAYEEYEPSRIVFGAIVDNKPWYGLKYYNCAYNAKLANTITMGDSEESRFVNNPNALIGIQGESYIIKDEDYTTVPLCTAEHGKFIPKSMKYNPSSNTITTVYEGQSYDKTCMLNGINARDLGYKYAFADKYQNVIFTNRPNIADNVYEFRDFLHTGSSCGVKGGCNNGSPRQPALHLKYKGETLGEAKIHFKLWRSKPASIDEAADINYEIVIIP